MPFAADFSGGFASEGLVGPEAELPDGAPIGERAFGGIEEICGIQHDRLPIRPALERYLGGRIVQSHHECVGLVGANLEGEARPGGSLPFDGAEFVGGERPVLGLVGEPLFFPIAPEVLDEERGGAGGFHAGGLEFLRADQVR